VLVGSLQTCPKQCTYVTFVSSFDRSNLSGERQFLAVTQCYALISASTVVEQTFSMKHYITEIFFLYNNQVFDKQPRKNKQQSPV
jgi:hypothetical protein